MTKTLVSGLGDETVSLEARGAMGTELAVQEGDVVFEIKVHGFPAAVAKSKEKALAQPVLAKF